VRIEIGHLNSGDVKGTITDSLRYHFVSNDVRRHRLISISYISLLPCHGRGRGFESRRPRHIFSELEESHPKTKPLILTTLLLYPLREAYGVQELSLSRKSLIAVALPVEIKRRLYLAVTRQCSLCGVDVP